MQKCWMLRLLSERVHCQVLNRPIAKSTYPGLLGCRTQSLYRINTRCAHCAAPSVCAWLALHVGRAPAPRYGWAAVFAVVLACFQSQPVAVAQDLAGGQFLWRYWRPLLRCIDHAKGAHQTRLAMGSRQAVSALRPTTALYDLADRKSVV